MTFTSPGLRQAIVAIRAIFILTLVLGVAYPAVITGVGQLALHSRANGSILSASDGQQVGSALLGQRFSDSSGAPLADFFQPRPSVAGDGYDTGASGGSNLGPNNPELVAAITERRAQVAAFNGVTPAQVPADAVTASASGLDPDISPAYALLQVDRVAQARGLPVAEVRDLVERNISGTVLGVGEERVNVLRLNLALVQLKG